MAVTKMEKVTIISDKSHQESVLQTFQGLQAIEIRDLYQHTENNAWVKDYFSKSMEESVETKEADWNHLQSQILEAIQFVDHHGNQKKQKADYLKRQNLSLQELEADFDEKETRKLLNNIFQLKGQWESIKKQKKDLLHEEDWLTGWQYLDINPKKAESAHTVFNFITISSSQGEDFMQELQTADLVYAEEIFHDDQEWLIALLYHQTSKELIQEKMNRYSVQIEEYPYEKPPKEMLGTIKQQLSQIYQKERELATQIGEQRVLISKLQWTEEVILALREREMVKDRLIQAPYLTILQGWIGISDKQRLLEQLDLQLGKDEVYVSFEEPTSYEVGAEVPTKLDNHPIVEPFEMLTEMYALPKYEEIDPTPWMVPFYFVFFGMMVADIGYGILMLIGAVIAQKVLVLPRGMIRFAKFFQILSIPTIIWGFIYGSFFGIAMPFEPLLSTSDDVIQILALSVVFGFIQILVGLFIAAKEHLKRKEYLDAIGNGFAWQGILLGIAIAVAGNMLLNNTTLTMVGAGLAVVSALGVLIVPIIQSDSKIKGVASGAYSLYGITGYIGDLVSYTRLMALGISGGSIAAAFNMLVAYMPPIARFSVGIVLIIALHALNIFLTLLSAYVHGARLQYVEFFGKFYSGGGKNFFPLKTMEKYVNIEPKKEKK